MVGPRVNVGSLSAHVKGMSRNWLGGADDSKTPSLSDLMKNGSKKTGNVFGDDDDESDSSSSSDSDSDSSSSSDSDDDDDDDKDKKKKKSKKSKKDTSKASFLSKINGVAAAPVEPVVDKAPLSNGKASKAVKKTAKTIAAATTSSSSSSSSDSESDSSPSKKAAAKTKKAAAKADAESSSSSDSDSSSSSSSSSDNESESEAEEEKEEEEEEEKTVAAPAAKNNTSSDSDEDMADQSFAMTARETGKEAVADSASQFTSQGFQLRRAADDADASDVTRIFKQAKLEGKQVWYFTAPASVPVTVIEKMAIPIKQAQKGKPILNHAGQDYGVSFDDNMTSKMIKLFIPNPAGDKYSLLNRDVDQTIHLKRVTQFAQPGGSSGGSGSTSTEVPAVLAPPPVKKTPRPQPAGLRNRFLPMGVNDNNNNNNSAAKKRKAAVAVAATADSDDSDDGGAAVKPTTKKARAATTTTTSVPVPSIPGMSTPKVTPVAPPVVPHSAALSSTPVVPPTPVVAAAEPKKSKDKKKKTTKAEAAAGDAMEIDEPVVDDKKEEKKEKKDKKEKKEKKEKKDKKEKAKAASQDTPVVKKVTPVPLPHIP